MALDLTRPSRRTWELSVVVVVAVGLTVAREMLPYAGWGLALRRAIAVVLVLAAVLWIGDLLVSAVREFRRGLAGDDTDVGETPASDRTPG